MANRNRVSPNMFTVMCCLKSSHNADSPSAACLDLFSIPHEFHWHTHIKHECSTLHHGAAAAQSKWHRPTCLRLSEHSWWIIVDTMTLTIQYISNVYFPKNWKLELTPCGRSLRVYQKKYQFQSVLVQTYNNNTFYLLAPFWTLKDTF